jgi:hypothetical protein
MAPEPLDKTWMRTFLDQLAERVCVEQVHTLPSPPTQPAWDVPSAISNNGIHCCEKGLIFIKPSSNICGMRRSFLSRDRYQSRHGFTPAANGDGLFGIGHSAEKIRKAFLGFCHAHHVSFHRWSPFQAKYSL